MLVQVKYPPPFSLVNFKYPLLVNKTELLRGDPCLQIPFISTAPASVDKLLFFFFSSLYSVLSAFLTMSF